MSYGTCDHISNENTTTDNVLQVNKFPRGQVAMEETQNN